MTHNTVQPTTNTLAARIAGAEPGFNKLISSLPQNVKPASFVGFDVSEPPDRSVPLLGWSYDWSDKGDDPPPWSDWSDKEE